MNQHEQKRNLLADMIAFAVVDGQLHAREQQFLALIAAEFEISDQEFRQLFHQEPYPQVIKTEFARIEQFYRLALLMHCDGVLHPREQVKIREIGLAMGLPSEGIQRLLQAMEISPTGMVPADLLLDAFRVQHN